MNWHTSDFQISNKPNNDKTFEEVQFNLYCGSLQLVTKTDECLLTIIILQAPLFALLHLFQLFLNLANVFNGLLSLLFPPFFHTFLPLPHLLLQFVLVKVLLQGQMIKSQNIMYIN